MQFCLPTPWRLAIGLLTLVLTGPAARADPPAATIRRAYLCHRARTPIAVDGKLDDPAWTDAPWSAPFVDIEGDAKPRPRLRTRMKMLWDDRYFYVAALLEEPHVWGTLTRHDSVIFRDNDFEVFIDPDGDNHDYYEFEINALNTGWDLLLPKPYRDGGHARDDWEISGLKTATHVDGTLNDPSDTDRSWSVEIAFPWSALAEHAHRPAPLRDGDQWRVNFSRVEWRHTVKGKTYHVTPGARQDNWVWSPQGVIDMHQPERWGYVQFTASAPGRAVFRPDPAGPVRDRLMRIYHAQNAYREAHKVWADSLDALGLPREAQPQGEGRPVFRMIGAEDYEVSISLQGPPHATWTVRSDSRLTRRPE